MEDESCTRILVSTRNMRRSTDTPSMDNNMGTQKILAGSYTPSEENGLTAPNTLPPNVIQTTNPQKFGPTRQSVIQTITREYSPPRIPYERYTPTTRGYSPPRIPYEQYKQIIHTTLPAQAADILVEHTRKFNFSQVRAWCSLATCWTCIGPTANLECERCNGTNLIPSLRLTYPIFYDNGQWQNVMFEFMSCRPRGRTSRFMKKSNGKWCPFTRRLIKRLREYGMEYRPHDPESTHETKAEFAVTIGNELPFFERRTGSDNQVLNKTNRYILDNRIIIFLYDKKVISMLWHYFMNKHRRNSPSSPMLLVQVPKSRMSWNTELQCWY